MVRKSFILIIILFVFSGIAFSQSIVINEVMFDVPGGDYHDEFVELFNADSVEINLAPFQIGDADERDGIIPGNDSVSLVLKPGNYLLILDGSYAENSVTYDSIIATGIHYAFINDGSFGKSGFSNTTAETVILQDDTGAILDQYTYSLDNEPGFSDERINPRAPNIAANWANSLRLGGSPGTANTVSQGNSLLIVESFNVRQNGANLIADYTILNLNGTTISPRLHVYIDNDFDHFSGGNDQTLLDTLILINPYETKSESVIRVYEGLATIDICLEVSWDSYSLNETKSLTWRSEEAIPVILNEICFAPPEGDPEWIELLNRGENDLKLTNFALILDEDTLVIASEEAVIPAYGFLLLKDDSDIPIYLAPNNTHIVNIPGWTNLKVSDQKIGLSTSFHEDVDSLHYDDLWWEGSHENRTLEKKNPGYANKKGMWGLCRDKAKSTPGKQNSWYDTEHTANASRFRLSSTYFSPDNLKNNSYLEIAVEEQNSGKLDVLIFDLRGRLVRELAAAQSMVGLEYFIWDGNNSQNRAMPTGTYIVYGRFRGRQSNWVEKKPVALYWVN